MDKFKRLFRVNKCVFIFLLGLLVIALIFGSCFALFLNDSDKSTVALYMQEFVGSIDSVDSLSLFFNGLFNNCFYGFFIWLLGISVIGVPIVLLMFFSKCFVLGFSVCSIISNYGVKGILFSLVYIFPHNVIYIFLYGLLTCYSIVFSIKILFLLFKKGNFDISFAFRKYFKLFVFCFIVLLVFTIYESFLEPIVFKFVFDLLGI